MSPTNLIDDLAVKSETLQAAMQSGQLARIDAAVEGFTATLEQVRAVGQWPADPALREALVPLAPLLDQARTMASLLADMTGQMHDMAVSKARDARQPLYARTGARMA